MELHARDERAILLGHDGVAQREVDPRNLALGGDLTAALHEWARVVEAVRRTDSGDGAAAAVVSRRGRQLATRVAEVMGAPVRYVDPLSGVVSVIDPPEVSAAPRPVPAPRRVEPTPWATGLVVSAFTLVLVLFAVLTLGTTLAETSWVLAVGANILVTAGLLPSVWLARRAPIWRWVAGGVAAAILLSWLILPIAIG